MLTVAVILSSVVPESIVNGQQEAIVFLNDGQVLRLVDSTDVIDVCIVD